MRRSQGLYLALVASITTLGGAIKTYIKYSTRSGGYTVNTQVSVALAAVVAVIIHHLMRVSKTPLGEVTLGGTQRGPEGKPTGAYIFAVNMAFHAITPLVGVAGWTNWQVERDIDYDHGLTSVVVGTLLALNTVATAPTLHCISRHSGTPRGLFTWAAALVASLAGILHIVYFAGNVYLVQIPFTLVAIALSLVAAQYGQSYRFLALAGILAGGLFPNTAGLMDMFSYMKLSIPKSGLWLTMGIATYATIALTLIIVTVIARCLRPDHVTDAPETFADGRVAGPVIHMGLAIVGSVLTIISVFLNSDSWSKRSRQVTGSVVVLSLLAVVHTGYSYFQRVRGHDHRVTGALLFSLGGISQFALPQLAVSAGVAPASYRVDLPPLGFKEIGYPLGLFISLIALLPLYRAKRYLRGKIAVAGVLTTLLSLASSIMFARASTPAGHGSYTTLSPFDVANIIIAATVFIGACACGDTAIHVMSIVLNSRVAFDLSSFIVGQVVNGTVLGSYLIWTIAAGLAAVSTLVQLITSMGYFHHLDCENTHLLGAAEFGEPLIEPGRSAPYRELEASNPNMWPTPRRT